MFRKNQGLLNLLSGAHDWLICMSIASNFLFGGLLQKSERIYPLVRPFDARELMKLLNFPNHHHNVFETARFNINQTVHLFKTIQYQDAYGWIDIDFVMKIIDFQPVLKKMTNKAYETAAICEQQTLPISMQNQRDLLPSTQMTESKEKPNSN